MNGLQEAGGRTSRAPVRNRRVYYLGGFDPRGAAFYHRLYREEAEKQGRNLGVDIEVGSRCKIGSHQQAWTIKSTSRLHAVTTDYRFLSWDDIVRRHWETNIFKLLGTAIKSYAGFVACGALGRIRAHYTGPFYSGIYPIAFLLLIGILSLVVGGALAAVVAKAGALVLLAVVVGLLGAVACFWWGMRLADRLGVLWLLRTSLSVYAWGDSMPECLNKRIEEFSDIIVRDQKDQVCDEVILVGHSVGSILAVSVVARMLDKSAENQCPNLTLVTLGQCIPMLSLIPGAVSFRRDLKTLAERRESPWLDMGARADPLCFSQVNPITISGIDSPAAKWPKMQVVRPFRMFSPEKYKHIRRNKLRLHFQYLMSSELQTDYDYFLLTAGPDRLSL